MPPTGSHYALTGEVVTMDAANRILPQGVVYIEGDTIRAVQSRGEPVPVGFERAPVLATRGTIYPGLMELHNHLSYDILPLWRAPRRFENRDQWMALVDKRRYISGPMEVLGRRGVGSLSQVQQQTRGPLELLQEGARTVYVVHLRAGLFQPGVVG